MEKALAYGTAIVNINTGKDYTIPQVKGMEKSYLINLLSNSKGGRKGKDGIEGGIRQIVSEVKDLTLLTIPDFFDKHKPIE